MHADQRFDIPQFIQQQAKFDLTFDPATFRLHLQIRSEIICNPKHQMQNIVKYCNYYT